MAARGRGRTEDSILAKAMGKAIGKAKASVTIAE
jgi:hypothetical protein